MRIARSSIIILITLICSLGCAGKNTPKSAANSFGTEVEKLVKASKNASNQSMKAEKRNEQKSFAEAGVGFAKRCLEIAPEEAACYYYRAVNTGLFYQAQVIAYQTGVKQMIEDCERSIQLDPKYASGGAYRLLGELYTKLPQTTIHPDDVTRDLEKGEFYFEKALRIDANYPENYLAFAENLLAQGKLSEAIDTLSRAKHLVPQWKRDESYEDWKKQTTRLENEIAKLR